MTGEVTDFIVGKRSKRTLRMLVNTLLLSGGHFEVISKDLKITTEQFQILLNKIVTAPVTH